MTDLELKLQEDVVKLKGVIIEQSKIILEYQKLCARIQYENPTHQYQQLVSSPG